MSFSKALRFMAGMATFVVAAVAPALAQSAPAFTPNEVVNVRSGAGLGFSVLSTTTATVTITGRTDFDVNASCNTLGLTGGWLRVNLDGIEGWVARCAGDITGDLAGVPVVSGDTGTIVPTRGGSNALTGNLLGDSEPTGKYTTGFVTASNANVRETPSVKAPVVARLSAGTPIATAVYVIGRNESGSWVRVQFVNAEGATQTGWMARFLLQLPRNWQQAVDVQ